MSPLDAALTPLPDALADLWSKLRPIGPWVTDAACARLGLDASDVFIADHPDVEEKALAERVCRRCPVRVECASYAAEGSVYGMWGGRWHSTRTNKPRAA